MAMEKLIEARYAACPKCQVPPGARCVSRHGNVKTRPCPERVWMSEAERQCMDVHKLPRGVYVFCSHPRSHWRDRWPPRHGALDAVTGERVEW